MTTLALPALGLGEAPLARGSDPVLSVDSDVFPAGGAAARFDANLTAIETLQRIEEEGRSATPAEQAVLTKYSGFGDTAYNDAFKDSQYDRPEAAWKARGDKLRELATEDEYRAIGKSRLNAFYTTPTVIKATWAALDRLGVNNISHPRVLEPSAGAGRFLGFQPSEMAARSTRTAVELDKLTGRVLAAAYPATNVYRMGYEEAPIPEGSVDVAISNVPFGDYPVLDKKFRKERRPVTRQIHNYFFAKTLDNLRPGGVLAFVTSAGTLNAPTSRHVRQYLHDRADFIGAVRLPESAFPDTKVVTDIVFMRKRLPGEAAGDATWLDTAETPLKGEYSNTVNLPVNQYFLQHPEMVLGEQSGTGTMYRGETYTVKGRAGQDLEADLRGAVARLPQGVIQETPLIDTSHRAAPASSPKVVRNGSFVVMESGKVGLKKDGDIVPARLSEDEDYRVRLMLRIRDNARDVLNLQLADAPEVEVKTAQRLLNVSYDAYVSKHGPLSSQRNSAIMAPDAEGPFLRALERQEVAQGKPLKAGKVTPAQVNELKMPIFSQKVVRGLGKQAPATAQDALALSLNSTGRLDFAYMAEALGRPIEDVRGELSQAGLVYKDPVGDWQTAAEYLSGDVREKLTVAKAASTVNKSYRANVEALDQVQPKDLKPSEISARLGAPWIPADDIDGFLQHLVRAQVPYRRGRRRYGASAEGEPTPHFFRYVPVTGEWVKENRLGGSSSLMSGQWGTSRMNTEEIVDRLLNAKQIDVTDPGEGDKRVRNPKETFAAQSKAQAIEEEFEKWVWSDPERARRLSDYYNVTFNNVVPRSYDGGHLTLPGMDTGWYDRLHPHQRDAIWRVTSDGTTLLAHEVGFGKTAVMAAGGMELRRLGLARKNLYVVPKATHGQFVSDFERFYPYAQILAPGEHDFTAEKRPEFVARMVTGDWDAVVLTQEQYQRIPVRPETEARFIRQEIENFRSALQEEREQGGDARTQKNIEKAIVRLEVKLGEKAAKAADISDRSVYFEDLGIDQLFVDESDAYKNLSFATRMSRIKGLPNGESARAFDMYLKVRQLQEQGNGRGVVFATGTPVANTIAELYTNMRYLQPQMLEDRGIQHFDAWAKTFGSTTEGLEQTPSGQYRTTQRFARFVNVPELSNIWQTAADVRVAAEVPELVRVRPRLVDGEGKAKRTVVATPPDEALIGYMALLAERADNMANVDPTEDNMLKLSSDARKASLDMRMVVPGTPENPQSKVNQAAVNIGRIWKETAADRGTQLVFLDLGTPKANDKVSDAAPAEGVDINSAEADTEQETRLLDNVYGQLRKKLEAQGIPAGEIAFAHDAKTNVQRERLYDRVRSGEIRVIVGSTGKMGAGVNIQNRAAALHHLDAPWRPRDIEQREGRILRQGNVVYGPKFDAKGNQTDPGKGVRIYTYVTERSFDAFMWQAIEAKAVPIRVIMRRETGPRTIEDADSLVMSASEAKAIASGNPDIMRRVQLQNNLTKLGMLKGSHTDSLVRARTQLAQIPKQVEVLTATIARMEQDAKIVPAADQPFAITVRGKAFGKDDRANAVLAITDAMTTATAMSLPGTVTPIGEYRGFPVSVSKDPLGDWHLTLTSPKTGQAYTTTAIKTGQLSGEGALIRLQNKLQAIPESLTINRQMLDSAQKNLAQYREQAGRPFEREDEFRRQTEELAALDRKLAGVEAEMPGASAGGTPVAREPRESPDVPEFSDADSPAESESIEQAEEAKQAAIAAKVAHEEESDKRQQEILAKIAAREARDAETAREAAEQLEMEKILTAGVQAEAVKALEEQKPVVSDIPARVPSRAVQFREEMEAAKAEAGAAVLAAAQESGKLVIAGVGEPTAIQEWDSPRGRRKVVGETTVRGEVRVKVQTGESGLLELVPPAELAGEVKRDEADVASRAVAAAAAVVEAEAAPFEGLDRQTLGKFGESMSLVVKASAYKALRKTLSADGELLSRQAIVDKDLAGGATIKIVGGERVLMRPNGNYRSEKQLSKTALDYATHRLATESIFAREMEAAKAEAGAAVLAAAQESAVPVVTGVGRPSAVAYVADSKERARERIQKSRASGAGLLQKVIAERSADDAAVLAREPWETRRTTWEAAKGADIRYSPPHKAFVMKALDEGKPVQAEVIGDYPDLVTRQALKGLNKTEQATLLTAQFRQRESAEKELAELSSPQRIAASLEKAQRDTDAERADYRSKLAALPEGADVEGWKKRTVAGDVFWIKAGRTGKERVTADLLLEVGHKHADEALGAEVAAQKYREEVAAGMRERVEREVAAGDMPEGQAAYIKELAASLTEPRPGAAAAAPGNLIEGLPLSKAPAAFKSLTVKVPDIGWRVSADGQWWSDGSIAVRGRVPEGLRKEGMGFNPESVMPKGDLKPLSPVAVTTDRGPEGSGPVRKLLWFDRGMPVQYVYYRTITRQYPAANFYSAEGGKGGPVLARQPVLGKQQGEEYPVGIIMPVFYEDQTVPGGVATLRAGEAKLAEFDSGIAKLTEYQQAVGIRPVVADKPPPGGWTTADKVPPQVKAPAPAAPAREPWEMTRAEFAVAENAPKLAAIQGAIAAGAPVQLTTQYRITPLKDPASIFMDNSGTVRIRRGKKSDALVAGQVDALAVQAGLKVPGVVDRVYHHAEVRDALAAGKPVPAAVVAEYKDLNPPTTAAPRPETQLPLTAPAPEKPLPARIDRDMLREYIGPSQWAAIKQGERGEEGEFFKEKLREVSGQIAATPKVYGQEGAGENAVVHLHYFRGGMDWYITERDTSAEQHQAFGLADFGDGGELGYISIDEITKAGAELDLYWKPKTLAQVRGAPAVSQDVNAPDPVTSAARIAEMPKPVSIEPEQATPHRVDGIIEQAQAEVAIAELRKPTVRSVRAGARDLRRRGRGALIFRLTDEQVREILRKQTPRGRAQDAALQNAAVASKVAQSKSEASTLGAWSRHPSNADVRTVDTKGSRGSAMLSGGAEGAGAGGGSGSGGAGSQPDSPGPKIDAGRRQVGLKGNTMGRSRPKFDQPRPPRIAGRRTRL